MVRSVPQRKINYGDRLRELLRTHKDILIVGADHVGANQMQKIRISLRGKAVILMGKNTIMRKIVRDLGDENPKLKFLLDYLTGNMGFVFCLAPVDEVRKVILDNKKPAAARAGTYAPDDCWVAKGSTGLDPGQTSFFQQLNIATKIFKGSIEIINDVHLIQEGERVTPSHVSLLSKLGIKPFFYRMSVDYVYEAGNIYPAEILDKTQDDLLKMFFASVRKLACVSLAAGLPNLATIPHSMARAFKNLLAIAVSTEVTFKEAEKYKEFLSDPEAYAAKHGLPTGPSTVEKEEKKEEQAEEAKEEEESDDDMGFSLFD